MAEYIERDALGRKIHTGMNIIKVIKTIIDEPAADVRPVVRGEWVPNPYDREWDFCTACVIGTRRREYGKNPDGTEYVTEYGYTFCPHCGADMRGERDETDPIQY